jgi:hypothetical protein
MTSGTHRQTTTSGLVRWPCYTRVIAAGRCSVLPGFQDGCRVTAGENGSEQRTQTHIGGQGAALICFHHARAPVGRKHLGQRDF